MFLDDKYNEVIIYLGDYFKCENAAVGYGKHSRKSGELHVLYILISVLISRKHKSKHSLHPPDKQVYYTKLQARKILGGVILTIET